MDKPIPNVPILESVIYHADDFKTLAWKFGKYPKLIHHGGKDGAKLNWNAKTPQFTIKANGYEVRETLTTLVEETFWVTFSYINPDIEEALEVSTHACKLVLIHKLATPDREIFPQGVMFNLINPSNEFNLTFRPAQAKYVRSIKTYLVTSMTKRCYLYPELKDRVFDPFNYLNFINLNP